MAVGVGREDGLQGRSLGEDKAGLLISTSTLYSYHSILLFGLRSSGLDIFPHQRFQLQQLTASNFLLRSLRLDTSERPFIV